MDSMIDNLKVKLKEKGYKLTTQRRIIYDVLLENQGKHLSPEEIHDMVKDKFPEVGLATVYRTLQLLDELNVVHRLNFNDGCSRYEISSNDEDHHHHHLVCLKCGKVIEVELDMLEELEEEIEKKGDFKITDHNVKFFGYCSECKNKSF